MLCISPRAAKNRAIHRLYVFRLVHEQLPRWNDTPRSCWCGETFDDRRLWRRRMEIVRSKLCRAICVQSRVGRISRNKLCLYGVAIPPTVRGQSVEKKRTVSAMPIPFRYFSFWLKTNDLIISPAFVKAPYIVTEKETYRNQLQMPMRTLV